MDNRVARTRTFTKKDLAYMKRTPKEKLEEALQAVRVAFDALAFENEDLRDQLKAINAKRKNTAPGLLKIPDPPFKDYLSKEAEKKPRRAR